MKLGLVSFLGNEFFLSNNFVNFNSTAIIFRLIANVKDLIIFWEWNTCAKSSIAQLNSNTSCYFDKNVQGLNSLILNY